MNRPKASRLGWHLLLALLMLLMQQGALRHGFQHIKGEDSSPTHTLCKDCLSFHAADQALASAPLLHLPVVGLPEVVLTLFSAPGNTPTCAAYQARAPPTVSA
jgi:hypothetical protein